MNTQPNFFEALCRYYNEIGNQMRSSAKKASIMRHPGDTGTVREDIYHDFLKDHLPMRCNILKGGYVFDNGGATSRQLDIIVTCDSTPRFVLESKGFSPVEGTLAVVSVKSKLTKSELIDSLDLMASIPNTETLKDRTPGFVRIDSYDNWPLKVVYAHDGLENGTILEHLSEFYHDSTIALSRRPDIIHVCGRYTIIRVTNRTVVNSGGKILDVPIGGWVAITGPDPDGQGFCFVCSHLQRLAAQSNYIYFTYEDLFNRVLNWRDLQLFETLRRDIKTS